MTSLNTHPELGGGEKGGGLVRRGGRKRVATAVDPIIN